MSSLALSQQATIDRLERRIAELEKRVARLEEKLATPTSSAISVSEKWKDRSLWRRLQTDMSMEQVESLLGVPKNVSGGNFTYWYYSSESWHSYVSFYKGRLSSWKEPD
jgi:uncharacterized protein YhaN